MRPGVVLFMLATGSLALGYIELSHQATRESWRAETARLEGQLEQAEQLAEERAEALAAQERDDGERRQRAARLAELDARILDAAAELASLESDRIVARERADLALRDLKEQVTALATIEVNMAVLGKRRKVLAQQIGSVETRLQEAEIGAAERQKRSEALDRHIAELAVRRETLLAGLGAAERSMATAALDKVAKESIQTAKVLPAPPVSAPPPPTPIPAVAPAAIVDGATDEPRNRARGLYQFGSLSADPEAASLNGSDQPGSLAVSAQGSADESEAANWAEDQYLLGLRLLSTAERSSGTRELSDAILAFKAVLGEWPKQRDPKRWAIARSDLGYALALLGKRTADVGVLEEAAAASRDALLELGRWETPLLWAAAQHHLGVSLDGLAEVREDSDLRQASIEALEQAIDAFKQAGANDDARKVERRLRESNVALPTETAD